MWDHRGALPILGCLLLIHHRILAASGSAIRQEQPVRSCVISLRRRKEEADAFPRVLISQPKLRDLLLRKLAMGAKPAGVFQVRSNSPNRASVQYNGQPTETRRAPEVRVRLLTISQSSKE